MMAHLVYDSLRELLPEGARSPKKVSRHSLYEVGNYSVDLLLEFESDVRIGMIGQVMNKQDCKAPAAELLVELVSGAKCAAQTKTNQYGEFKMEFEAAGRLRLQIHVGENLVEVPLMGTAD